MFQLLRLGPFAFPQRKLVADISFLIPPNRIHRKAVGDRFVPTKISSVLLFYETGIAIRRPRALGCSLAAQSTLHPSTPSCSSAVAITHFSCHWPAYNLLPTGGEVPKDVKLQCRTVPSA